MKILHIGNLANNSYKLAKFQRQLGYDAHLELQHYQLFNGDNPSKEDAEIDGNFPEWIHVNNKAIENTINNRINLLKRVPRVINRKYRDFKKGKIYDVIHAQTGAPIYAQFFGGNKFFSQCTGSDLRDIAFRKSLSGFLLRRAYRKSDCVFFSNIDHWKYLDKLNIKNYQFLPNPLDLDRMKKIDSDISYPGYDFVIFHPVRHLWKKKYLNMQSTKGNDKLIKAFATFVKKRKIKALLLMIDSGLDVDESKKLIDDLGITENVKFIQRQNKIGLLKHIKSCDLVADQFEIGAFGGSALEAMACGTPLLTYLDSESLIKCYEDPPQIFNAFTESEIYENLCLALDSQLSIAGDKLMHWMDQNHHWKKITKKITDIYRH